MKLYSEGTNYKLYQGNMLDMLEDIKPNSIDSIVTDPPYELNFMNKGWDNSGIAFQKETWEKCLTVLKPGGYLLAFGGSRTFHRIACAIEDAGFEIRDTIMWLYGSGFPKSMNLGKTIEGKLVLGSANVRDIKKLDGEKEVVGGGWNSNAVEQEKRNQEYEQIKTTVNYTTELGKKWDGWGTSLKPSFEPIIVARKPCEGSCVDNVLKWGVGGINIDECRVPLSDNEPDNRVGTDAVMHTDGEKMWYGENGYAGKDVKVYKDNGRYPANIILTYDEDNFDEVCGGFPNTKNSGAPLTMPDLRDVGKKSKESIGIDKLSFGQVSHAKRKPYVYAGREYNNKETSMFNGDKPQAPSNYADEGSAARYFYCAKASKRDRDEGLEEFSDKCVAFSNQGKAELKRGNTDFSGDVGSPLNAFNKVQTIKNIHPTVKPTDLMQYLVRLVTPNGGTVLDPFNGSGSTGKAVMYENHDNNKGYSYIGIELTEEYLPISTARIEFAIKDVGIVDYSVGISDKKKEEQKKPFRRVSLFE